MDSSWIARYFDNNGLHHWHYATKQRPVSEHLWSPRYWIDRRWQGRLCRWQAGVSELYEVSVRTWSTVLLGWYPCFWIHSRHWSIPAVKPQAWPGDRKLDWSGRIWRGVLQHVVIPFWDLCLDVQRTNNFFKKIADIEQVCFEDLLFFGDLAACRCRTCLPSVVSLRIMQLRVMTSRATWTPGRRSCCRAQRFDFRSAPLMIEIISILNESRSLTSKNGILKVNKRDFFAKMCSTSLHVSLFLQMQTTGEHGTCHRSCFRYCRGCG